MRWCVALLLSFGTFFGHVSAQISKPVFAHFIVGNTFPYTREDWNREIALASSKGIDGFILNVGRDDWQAARVADAFFSAINTPFKLAFSFDMASFPCGSLSDGDVLRNYVNAYRAHSAQMQVNNRPLVTTFGGQFCQFGQSSVNEGWRSVFKTNIADIFFMPAFFWDPSMYGALSSADGAFSWNSGWPMGNYDITNGYDDSYRQYLNGRQYMAAVSPWFFTHYGPDSYNKNQIYRSDNWLLATRWEMLVRDRDLINMVEVISWNDYGESHYMGPITGAQPGSESWVNGFDHQGWLDLQQYYITAYKTGAYPPIIRDRIFLWARPYPALAIASNDPVGRPLNYNFTEDFIWGVIFLTSPGRLRLRCGSQSVTQNLPAGVSKVRVGLVNSCTPTATLRRNNREVLRFSPPRFRFSTSPTTYNYNAFVASSP